MMAELKSKLKRDPKDALHLSGNSNRTVVANQLGVIEAESEINQEQMALEKENGKEMYIPLSQIHEREKGNEFRETEVNELARSIRRSGLGQAIIVKADMSLPEDQRTYYLISGHRRTKAMRQLFEETHDEQFAKIRAIVFDMNSITEDKEAMLYANTNIMTRQLTFGEIMKHVIELYERYYNSDEKANLPEASDTNEDYSIFSEDERALMKNKAKFIQMLTKEIFSDGVSESNIKRALFIYNNSNKEFASYIYRNELPVSVAYDIVLKGTRILDDEERTKFLNEEALKEIALRSKPQEEQESPSPAKPQAKEKKSLTKDEERRRKAKKISSFKDMILLLSKDELQDEEIKDSLLKIKNALNELL